MSIKTVCVVGAGAMGAFYASKFFDMQNNCVTLLAGRERYKRLKQEGLIVNGKHYPVPVVSPEESHPPDDLIIVAVKEQHLDRAIQDMKQRVGQNSTILSVMNGIDSEERIGSVYGMEKLLYAVALGIDSVREGNTVNYTNQGRLLFGEAQNKEISNRVRQVQAILDRAGINYETPEDMIRALWWKFMINVGVNQASAVLRGPYGLFQTSTEARELVVSAMREVIMIAEKEKIDLNEEDIKKAQSILDGLDPRGKTSMLQDVEARRKTEVEMFSGRVTGLGKKYGLPTPVNETLYRIIRVMEKA